jgi:hypothetical protein
MDRQEFDGPHSQNHPWMMVASGRISRQAFGPPFAELSAAAFHFSCAARRIIDQERRMPRGHRCDCLVFHIPLPHLST